MEKLVCPISQVPNHEAKGIRPYDTNSSSLILLLIALLLVTTPLFEASRGGAWPDTTPSKGNQD
jgi:hypothetical protein